MILTIIFSDYTREVVNLDEYKYVAGLTALTIAKKSNEKEFECIPYKNIYKWVVNEEKEHEPKNPTGNLDKEIKKALKEAAEEIRSGKIHKPTTEPDAWFNDGLESAARKLEEK